jgi:threonine/homoserine/homoserine lactone efflux protein
LRRRDLVVETLLISPSGALSPGPLSAMAVAVGLTLGALGGLAIALGHMLFELPYVALLSRLAPRLRRSFTGTLGRALLLVMGGFTAYFAVSLAQSAVSVLRGGGLGAYASPVHSLAGAILVGVAYTGLNPFFLAWWVTAGFPLVEGASRIPGGLVIMYSSHVWLDYAWLAFLALGGGAASLMGSGVYAAILAALSAVLGYFAVKFLLASLGTRGFLGEGYAE